MIAEKVQKIKKIMLTKEAKKIITTVAITFAVFMFFVWLGVGMYISVPNGKRGELWPVFAMYFVFPALIFIFGAKRSYDVLNGREELDDDDDEELTE